MIYAGFHAEVGPKLSVRVGTGLGLHVHISTFSLVPRVDASGVGKMPAGSKLLAAGISDADAGPAGNSDAVADVLQAFRT